MNEFAVAKMIFFLLASNQDETEPPNNLVLIAFKCFAPKWSENVSHVVFMSATTMMMSELVSIRRSWKKFYSFDKKRKVEYIRRSDRRKYLLKLVTILAPNRKQIA